MSDANSGTAESCRGRSLPFPGPLLCGETQKEDVMRFIQAKCQDCFSHLDDPDEHKSFFFRRIMELFCKREGSVTMAEVAVVLFRSYGCVRRKLSSVKDQEDWCLPLAELLCSKAPEVEHRRAVVKMGDGFASSGWVYAAHICYVVAQVPLGTRKHLQLIGCEWFITLQSADKDIMERTEVYEFVLSLSSGLGQPHFQEVKYLNAWDLLRAGHCDKALLYCENIVKNIFRFPWFISSYFIERVIMLSSRLLDGRRIQEAEWLFKCGRLHKAFSVNNLEFSDFMLQQSLCGYDPHEFQVELGSRYIVGELLGKGCFGAVYAGVRKADKRQVAIKFVPSNDLLPGSKPLEMELMEMVCKPPRCESVVELLEWLDMGTCYILVLERPIPCMDLLNFCKIHRNRCLPEFTAREVVRQLVQAIRHCFERGVLHEDIRPDNILVNTETLETILIDFGLGKLMTENPADASAPYPYVWNLGVLLSEMICGEGKLHSVDYVIHKCFQFVSRECCDVISHCLKSPAQRPTYDEILSHGWFKLELKCTVQAPDTDLETQA